MTLRAVARTAFPLIAFSLLTSCGEMDSVLQTGEAYRVVASVNGEFLGDGASVIRAGDEIFPAFAVTPGSGSGLTALSAQMRDSRGEIVGEAITYLVGARGERSSGGLEVALESFSDALPRFSLPQGAAIGRHDLVFEALGGRGVLWRTEIPFFYVAGARFDLLDISVSLPGVFETRLIPPGINVLLEARLDFDARLDPYLAWIQGGTVLKAGRMSDGAGALLWEAPGRAAFYAMRLEIYPFAPAEGDPAGISRDFVLPVSASAQAGGFFFAAQGGFPARNALARAQADFRGGRDLRAWHRLEGTLADSLEPQDEERFLTPLAGTPGVARWASVGYSYGLSTGDEEAFLLAPTIFSAESADPLGADPLGA
ncbi:MAG: hypothetical protein FWE09_06125, partial [Treponema sp.]|nr:hypothetical protein [Treponema sp.]